MTTKYQPPPSCCEYHGMEDGCCQGKLCPARRAMSDAEIASLGQRVPRWLVAPFRFLLPARLPAGRAPLSRRADTTTF